MSAENHHREADQELPSRGQLFEAVEKELEGIFRDAEAQAAGIIAKAESEAARIIAKAESEAATTVAAAEQRANASDRERAKDLQELQRQLATRTQQAEEACLDLAGALHDAARALEADGAGATAASGGQPTASELPASQPTPDPGPKPIAYGPSSVSKSTKTNSEAQSGDEPPAQAPDANELAASLVEPDVRAEWPERGPSESLGELRERLIRAGKNGPVRLTREEPGRAMGSPSPPSLASEGAILLATQMAVTGSSREEIEQRLRNDFGISETEPILGSLLGDPLAR